MGDPATARALARGALEDAGLTEADLAMLRYALALTRSPGEVTGGDVEALRDQGFDDAAIHDICHVTGYYNYVNRMADGLGVELEPRWTDEELTLGRSDFEATRDARRAMG